MQRLHACSVTSAICVRMCQAHDVIDGPSDGERVCGLAGQRDVCVEATRAVIPVD